MTRKDATSTSVTGRDCGVFALIRRVAVVLAVGAVVGPLMAPPSRAAVPPNCGGDAPKACNHPLGPGGLCVPASWECCNTRKCAMACTASWKRCMNGGTEFATCEATAGMCTTEAGGDPAKPKFCEELVMTTGSQTCGQPASIAGNIGWCCRAGELCGEHFPDCLCSTPCGSTCCTPEQECDDGACRDACPSGQHHVGLSPACVCDSNNAPPCGIGNSAQCCARGATCQRNVCIRSNEPEDADTNFLQNMHNLINQAAETSGGRHVGPRFTAASLLGPIGTALLDLAAVNGLRTAAGRAFGDRPVDPAYHLKVVAARPRLPKLASGPGLDARAAKALDKLLAAQANAFAQALGAARSLARARGALAQADLKQASKQVRAATRFAERAAKALRGVPRLRAKAVARLTSGGATEVNASAAAVTALQASVESSGVPPDLAALLQALGADSDDLARVREALLVASPGGPALIAPLADASDAEALKSMARELGRFARSARRNPIQPVEAGG